MKATLADYLRSTYGSCRCNRGCFCPGAICMNFESWNCSTYAELAEKQKEVHKESMKK